MLADELDYVVGVDTHLDEHVLAVVAAPAGAVLARRAVRGERARLRGGAAVRGEAARCARLGDRGHRQLRRRPCPLPRRPRRDGARDQPHAASRAAVARQGRLARRGPDGAGALASETLALPAQRQRREALRLLLIARRSAVDVRREALGQLRGVIVTAPDRLRERAARAAGREGCSSAVAAFAAQAAQAPTSSRHGSCCAASPAESKRQQPRPPSSKHEILGHVRALAPQAARRAGRRTDRRRAADRRLVTPRPCPLRSRLRPPRRRRRRSPPPAARQPGIGSAAAATANSTALCTPSSSTAASTTRRPRTTSRDASPRARAAATPPACSSATSPATSTGYCKPGAADDLTSHRSIIPERWDRRACSPHNLRSHNPEVAGSNPAPATRKSPALRGFSLSGPHLSTNRRQPSLRKFRGVGVARLRRTEVAVGGRALCVPCLRLDEHPHGSTLGGPSSVSFGHPMLHLSAPRHKIERHDCGDPALGRGDARLQ